MPKAQIEYGASPASKSPILKLIGRVARKFDVSALADAARLSRKQFSPVIGHQVESRSTTIRQLLQAVMALEIDR